MQPTLRAINDRVMGSNTGPQRLMNVRTRLNSGFTLMELMVICAILIILAAVAVPNYVAFKRSRDLKDLEASIIRLPTEARNQAVTKQNPVRIRIDGTSLIMESVPTDGNTETLKQVDLGSSLQVDSTQLNGQSVDEGAWEWNAYPDGTSDTGGIQFTEDTTSKSLVIPTTGPVQWILGDLPDPSLNQWPAGQLDVRGTTAS